MRFLLLLISFLFSLGLAVERAPAAHTPKEVERLWLAAERGEGAFIGLRRGWSYVYEDSDEGDEVGPLSTPPGEVPPADSSRWQPWDWHQPAANSAGAGRLWLSRVLPEMAQPDKSLLIANLQCDALAVFLDGRQLYASGSFQPGFSVRRPANRLHWVPLPSDAGGKLLQLLLHSNRPELLPPAEPILLYAPQSSLTEALLADAWYRQAFGSLFLFVGIYALVAHLVRRRYGLSFSPWFGFLAISLGLSQLFAGNLLFLSHDGAEWYYHAGLLAVLLFPIGLWRFVEISLGAGWGKLIRRCWQLQIVVVLVLWVPDVVGWTPFGTAGQLLGNGALALQLLVGVGEGWRHLRKRQTSLTALGVLIFSLAGLVDIAVAFLPFTLETELYPWGALALIVALAVGQERAAGEAQIQLRRQADALQRQQQYLEELVEERTAELRLATRAAEEASQAKSQFLANMSHDLRTPLNAILGYAQLFERDRRLNGTHREGAGIIRQSGEHLLLLINDILDISRIEAGKLTVQSAAVELPALIGGVVEMVRPRAREGQLHFHCQVDDDLPRVVLSDEKRLRQLLLNLLGNAVRYTDKGEVRLVVGCREGKLLFQVIDSGIGIASEHLEAIFAPFQQVSSQAGSEGAGLGLAICRTIARQMGGDVLVQSSPGQGSTFSLELPCVLPEKPSTAFQSRAEAAQPPVAVGEAEHPAEEWGGVAAPLPQPLPEAYGPLCLAAGIGDIETIVQEIVLLRTRLPEHDAFLDCLSRLAAEFDIPALQRLLPADGRQPDGQEIKGDG